MSVHGVGCLAVRTPHIIYTVYGDKHTSVRGNTNFAAIKCQYLLCNA